MDIRAADLVVLDTTTPDSAAPNSTIAVSYTVTNLGDVTATSDWYDYIFLSNDAVYDGSDTYLYNRYTYLETPLTVDGTYTVNANITLPNNGIGQPGNRYLLFVTDINGYQSENNETNNVKAVPLTITGQNSDLVVSAATAPTEAIVGQQVGLSWTVQNQGALTTSRYDWYDEVYLSSDIVLDGTDTRITQTYSGYYNSYSTLATGASYTVNQALTLPSNVNGTQYLLFATDRYNYLGEGDESNNVKALPINIAAPDLTVSNATAPMRSYPGNRIEVNWTVENKSSTEAQADWYDSVYLSDDATFNSSTDTLLKNVQTGNLTPLASGANYSVTQQLNLPSTTTLGSHYLLFITDSNSSQGETDETNNTRAVPIIIGDLDPDLTVTTATAPTAAILGETIAVDWTVVNSGTLASAATWKDTVYLSTDAVWDTNDVALADQAGTTPLGVGESYTSRRSLTLSGDSVGDRYLLFVTDSNRQQNERNETNNIKVLPITLTAPDLVVSEATTNTTKATWGEGVAVSWTVTNASSVTAPADWSDQIYLSDDTTLDVNDKYLGFSNIAANTPLLAGSSYAQSLNVLIPTGSTGSKYLLIVADANDYQGETDNTNNIKAVSIDLVAPNLQVTSVTAPTTMSWGENINVSWQVTNQGTGSALANWYDGVYLSTNPTLDGSDSYLGNFSAATSSPLASGNSYNLNGNVTIPTLAPGTWYLLIGTDNNNNQLRETNDVDNVLAATIEIKAPDLVVSAAIAPETGILGQAIAVNWTVTNQGTGSAVADWYDEVFLSKDSIFDNLDTHLNYQWTGEKTPLFAGNSYTTSSNITVPNVAAGEWYILFTADRYNYQAETDNTNNVKSLAITIGAPDIELTAATAPATASVGETIGVNWTVTNTGNIAAPADWYDYVYLSNDASFDNSDVQVGYSSSATNTPLNAGSSYTQNLDITIPQGTTGDRYLLFIADRNNNQGESNETNNLKAVSINLGVPDLVVTQATAPISAIVGNIVPISWTVTNSSDTFAAIGDWYDKVYLSDDASLDSTDSAIASWWTGDKTPLAPGASYNLTQNITLPNVSAGDRYLLFVADGSNSQAETLDSNNIKAVLLSLLAPADLVVSNVVAPTLTIGDPAIVTVSWDVTNSGLSSGNVNTWVDRIVASKDNISGNGDDIILANFTHTGELATNASYSRSETLRLPPAFVGRYQLFVQTDVTGQVFENGKEANNASMAANVVDVVPIPYADLAFSSVSSNQAANSGQPLTVSWTVVNSGIGITSTNAWSDTIQLATDPEGKNIVAKLGSFDHVGSLAVGGSYNRTVDVTLPNGLSGTHYLVLNTGGPFEFIYNNNNTYVSSPVQVTLSPPVDLVVTNITAPTSVQSGDKIDVSWTVANSGTGDAKSSWYDKVSLQIVGDPNAELIELGTFAYGNTLTPGKSYTRSEQLVLPSTIGGQYQVVVTTNATGSQYELARDNNTTKDNDLMLVSLLPRPDLQVQEIVAPTTVSAGGTVSLDYTVINQGTVATNTPNWNDKVYLSLDNVPSLDDLVLGNLTSTAALGAGESYRNTTGAFVVPKYFRGDVFLIVETDASRQVNEFPADANNSLAVALNIISLEPADLVTSNVVAPDQAYDGSTIEVRYSVANLGIGETDRNSWTDTIWLTRDKNRPSPITSDIPSKPDDILLGTFTHNGSIAVGESYENIVNVTIPKYITGEWYITPWSDSYDVILEDSFDINVNPDDPNELDSSNYKSRPITILLNPPPDLVVTSVVPTAQAKGGDAFSVSWTVTNQGANGTRESNWSDTIYLSDSPTLQTPGATYWDLGTVKHDGTLDASSSYTGKLDTILSPSAAGKYVIVKTNSNGSAWESIYIDNNERSVAVDVTATPSDLIVTNVKTLTENFSGETTTIEWTVQNVGAPTWAGTRYWYDEVWVSPDSTFIPQRATKVGFFAYSSEQPLGTGESYTQVQDVTLPAGFDGEYYIYVSTDYSYDRYPYDKFKGSLVDGGGNNDSYRQSFEYRAFENPENNLGVASIPIIYREPDLQVTNLIAPLATPNSGETIAVTWTVTNVGTRDTREDSWYDRVYLSRDPSLDASDITLGSFGRINGLEMGSTYTQTANLTLPDGVNGDYYLLVFADSNITVGNNRAIYDLNSDHIAAKVPEFQDEGNNITSVLMPIILSNPADLVVSSIIVPERVTLGQPVNITYTVTNAGTGNTPIKQSSWDDLIYLSRDEFLDLQSDFYLGASLHNGGLGAGDSYTVSQTLNISQSLTGPFYIFVITDPLRQEGRGKVFEGSNEGNNATPSTQPLIIEVPPPSDLQVDEIKLPTTAVSGDKVQLEWTVTNHNATNSAKGQWSDAVYLSTDSIWDINDAVIGRSPFSGILAPGASYTSKLEAPLPPALPGQYRIIVRPDIFNTVYEAENEANNLTTSASVLNVTVDSLQLNSPLDITLSTGQSRLYQLDVAAGQTLQIDLTSNAVNAANEIFISFEAAPTSTSYDAAYEGVLATNQSLIVPTTKPGPYYILVRGQFEPSNNTPATLLAKVLPFSITDVETDRGGDSRYVTTSIFGAQFNEKAIVKLVRPGIAEYNPVNYKVVDSTNITAIFDLTDAPHGLYDVKVINPDGTEAILPYRYLVERTIEPDVTVGLGGARVLAPGSTGIYGVSVQSLTNIDTPYVHFQFGVPELGTNTDVFNFPYTSFSSNLRGSPENTLKDVPWASLVSDTNNQGEILAPGYAFDLPTGDFVGQTFNIQTYQGLQEMAERQGVTVNELLGKLKEEGVSDGQIAFTFHILATATALTRDEFVAEQTTEALRLRDAILSDATASQALMVLAADANAWTTSYLAALETAGLLRAEGTAPPVRTDPLVVSLVATLATGILLGSVEEQIISNGDLISFFEQIRKWYGDNDGAIGQALPPSANGYNLGLTAPTHFEAFKVYVPYGEARVDLPSSVDVLPPNFSSFFNAAGTLSDLAAISGPLGYGEENFVPQGEILPYTIQFENAATAAASVGEVRIVTQLDADLDPRTFSLGDLRLGDLQIHIPAGRGAFQGEFDFTRSKGFILRVSAGLDPLSNTATWLLQAIDPETGEVITDPDKGLLPPNNANDIGTGFVTYTVKPNADLVTGTEITSTARIIYNTAAPYDTPQVTNTIDGAAPTTTLTATPLVNGGVDYQVQWRSVDDAGGSGVKHVTVYVAEDGGNFKIWQQQTNEKNGIYTGRAGHTYEFLAIATDNAGNQEQPRFGIATPSDGSSVNLGALPTFNRTTLDLGTAPVPSVAPSTNQLFVTAEQRIPNTPPVTNPSEFTSVLRPFAASAFATGIKESDADIGPMAISVLADNSVIFSGGTNRGSLFHVAATGGKVTTPLATLAYPVFDLAVSSNGNLWATTGGGPLLEINAQTGEILHEYGDSLTQSLAIQPETGLIYVSSGNGIEIFNPTTKTFSHYSNLRVGNLAFAPDGSLWAATWPERGDIVRFDAKNKPQKMLHFDGFVDSIAFGQEGTVLEGLLFVSNNNGELTMVDLATLRHVAVATGGSRGDIVETTDDGRVLLSQSNQIDVFQPIQTPHVVGINPPDDATITLPKGSIAVTFDADMFVGSPSSTASVTNPNNYLLTGKTTGRVPVLSVIYDRSTRTALLNFDAIGSDYYELQVVNSITSATSVTLEETYRSDFLAISDFLPFIDLSFSNPRSNRADSTISYDVTLTNRSDNDLILPLLLGLDPAQYFTGQPVDAVGLTQEGGYLIDLSTDLPDGRLKAGESITSRTITVSNADFLRVDFAESIYTLPYPNAAPLFTSAPVTSISANALYQYNAAALDPDGVVLSYLLLEAAPGMSVDTNTGVLTWLPTATSSAENKVILQVYDSRGGHATQEFTVNVAGGNHKPLLTALPKEVKATEGKPLTLAISATDADSDRLVYWADNLPSGAIFDSITHQLTWTPDFSAAGTYNVRFSVSDGIHTVSQITTLLVAPKNQAPTLTGTRDLTVREGEKVRIQLQGSDPEGSELNYFSNLLPGGATIDPRTGLFEWTPAYFQAGEFIIPFSVSDGKTTTTKKAKINVTNVNAAPVFDTLDSWQVTEGQTVRFRASAFDPDNPSFIPQERAADGTLTLLEGSQPSVTYTATGLPTGASFDAETAIFTWTPDFTNAGNYSVAFTATDDGNGTGIVRSSQVTVPIEILNLNRSPEITPIGNQTLKPGEVRDVLISTSDLDNNPLLLTATGLTGYGIPSFATFTDNGNGTALLHLTPGTDDGGDYAISLTATDNGDGDLLAVRSDKYEFIVSVDSPNAAPHLSFLGDKVAVVGEAMQFLIKATDKDQDGLTFSTTGLPLGATLNTVRLSSKQY